MGLNTFENSFFHFSLCFLIFDSCLNVLANIVKEFLIKISENNPEFIDVFLDAIFFDYANEDLMNDEFFYRNTVSGIFDEEYQKNIPDQEKSPNHMALHKQQFLFKKLKRIGKAADILRKLERDCELCMSSGEYVGQFEL